MCACVCMHTCIQTPLNSFPQLESQYTCPNICDCMHKCVPTPIGGGESEGSPHALIHSHHRRVNAHVHVCVFVWMHTHVPTSLGVQRTGCKPEGQQDSSQHRRAKTCLWMHTCMLAPFGEREKGCNPEGQWKRSPHSFSIQVSQYTSIGMYAQREQNANHWDKHSHHKRAKTRVWMHKYAPTLLWGAGEVGGKRTGCKSEGEQDPFPQRGAKTRV